MFADIPAPRIFALPPGADFPRLLVEGLLARFRDQPPEALARIEIYVNTRRMQRRLREVLIESGARLLPRLRLVTDPGTEILLPGLPPPVPGLRRRLELMQLVARLLEQEPGLAPPETAFDLAESLSQLMGEMQEEGVAPEVLAELDVSEHASHWQRCLSFINLVQHYFGEAALAAPDTAACRRMAVERMAADWATAPPANPVLVAGSTGSRGTTARLMEAVAGLPNGALVLPGFDFDMPDHVWHGLGDASSGEDHPQFRFHALLQRLDATPGSVRHWVHEAEAPDPGRNALISLSLRPAPITDQWMTEGGSLGALAPACAGMSLIEAPSPRAEALAIAIRLRKAAEDGTRAALVTSDRGLARQVTAALDRWGIVPDDSAGSPLALSAPGRFLRHVAALFGRRLTAQALITLLKHPLAHSASDRGPHLLHVRNLDLHLRRHGPAFPDRDSLVAWAALQRQPGAPPWADWLGGCLHDLETITHAPLAEYAARHVALAERLAAGPAGESSGELWRHDAGSEARAAIEELLREAEHGGSMAASTYVAFFDGLLHGREVRQTVRAHPRIMIWGTLEARAQGADLVILGGLNEGTWPQIAAPDPWLNRPLRRDAGLLLPERQIGLSAHDYQQAVAAPEVMLCRCLRDAEAVTVPSRWLNRLTNLLQGLPDTGGPAALDAMRARGQQWLDHAAALEADYAPVAATRRPSPRPPVPARPRSLSVTAIERLIRDPYAIYARYLLRLKPLDPLHPRPDALLRGQVLHRVVERFVTERPPDAVSETRDAARGRLLRLTAEVLAETVPWPAARHFWAARLERVADWFLEREAGRSGKPVLVEKSGSVMLDSLDFRLTAKPDRIDELPDGRLEILDYKTGAPPSGPMQEHFAKQLLLEAAMAERGAFGGLGGRDVARIIYVGLGANPRELATEVTPELNARTWSELERLIAGYMTRERGYTARRAPRSQLDEGDYDHLARLGEWDTSDPPHPEDVGGPE
jgi:ATP-dependent helicase/nuclease subunit B